jgi:hypothetical protein
VSLNTYQVGNSYKFVDSWYLKNGKEVVDLQAIRPKPYWPDYSHIVKEVKAGLELKRITKDLEKDPNSHHRHNLEEIRLY